MSVVGCVIPVTQTVRVGENRTLRVVDARTARPVPQATASYGALPDRVFPADASGKVFLQAASRERTYWMPPAPVCPPPWHFDAARYIVIVRAPGYAPTELPQTVMDGESSDQRPPPLTIRLAPAGSAASFMPSAQTKPAARSAADPGFATPP